MTSSIPSYAIVGHRGAPQIAPPGNTLESLRRAIEVGAQMLEVDVRVTRDDVLVIDHEAVRSLNGTETSLRDRPNSVWQTHAAEFGTPLPTLEEVFALARQTGVALMLDLKDATIEGLLARAIRNSRISYERLLVAGASETSRQILRALDPKIPLSLTLDADAAPLINGKLLSEIDTQAVTWHYSLITPQVVAALHARGIVVYAWTVNLAGDMRRMRDQCGVDGIITNAPGLLASL